MSEFPLFDSYLHAARGKQPWYFLFYFKDFKHFDDARVFCFSEGCRGIFKNKNYLNSTLLFQLNVVI